MIDTVAFKVFAILMCQGSTYDKANVLFDMCLGLDRLQQNTEDETLTHNSSR